MTPPPLRRFKEIPQKVHVVLKHLAEMRSTKVAVVEDFNEKIRSLSAEELEPRSMFLLVRELSDGRIRFIIKDRETNSFIDMLDYA